MCVDNLRIGSYYSIKNGGKKQFLHIFVWQEGRNMRKRLAKCRISRYDKIRKECPKGRKGGMAA